ncbi:zinc finger protein 385A [Athene noctua]|uniref:zinc finger protein 385A n=1 Tax=Athene noctua TaxID=126797 RepID=UPI003EBDDE67
MCVSAPSPAPAPDAPAARPPPWGRAWRGGGDTPGDAAGPGAAGAAPRPPPPARRRRRCPAAAAAAARDGAGAEGGAGAALAKPRRPVIACSVCQIRFNSESQAAAHYQGNRHARRLKGLEAARARRGGTRGTPRTPPAPHPPRLGRRPTTQVISPQRPQPRRPRAPLAPRSPPGCGCGGTGGGPGGAGGGRGRGGEGEGQAAAVLCSLQSGCELPVTAGGAQQRDEAQDAGGGAQRAGAHPRLPAPRGGCGDPPAEAPERSFHCQICNVRLNSELQLKQHISSRRHRDGVAGKPNPLLSRHKKPRTPPELAPLPFPKELPKALAGGGLLPPPLALAAAAAAMAAPHWPCAPPGPPSCRGPPLAPALLRPAPGPLRPAHTPLLFSPY